MSKDNSNQSFNIEKLQQLLELMEKHGVTEVKLNSEQESWVLRRGPKTVAAAPVSYAMPTPTYAQPAMQAAPAQAAARTEAPAADNAQYILCPTIGTFYSAPSPEDPPFVKVGDRVNPETVVCMVEAMKVFNEIQAKVSGVIEAVIPKNGDAVDVDAKLFRIRPA